MSKTRDNAAPVDAIPTTWAALNAMHALRPIHDRVELENATDIIDTMAGHKLNADQEDYLDALATLVDAYETAHDPVEVNLRGVEALRALVEEHEMSAADVARLLGVHRSAGSKILNGERSLTAKHIRVLADHFAVSADLFVD